MSWVGTFCYRCRRADNATAGGEGGRQGQTHQGSGDRAGGKLNLMQARQKSGRVTGRVKRIRSGPMTRTKKLMQKGRVIFSPITTMMIA
jgi:hypothetical protein